MKRLPNAIVLCVALASCATSDAPTPPVVSSPASPAAAPPAPSVPAAKAVGSEFALANPGFEADPQAGRRCPPQWNCTMHADPGSFRIVVDDQVAQAGKRSGRVERVTNEPWALLTQVVRDPAVRGARLRFSMAVRVQGVPGGGGPFYLAHGTGGRPLNSESKLVSGSQEWQRVSIEFSVPREAEVIEVGATLEGPGTLWIDEARLELLENPGPAKKPV